MILNEDESEGYQPLKFTEEETGETSGDEELDQIDLTQLIICDHTSMFSMFLRTMNTILCLISSYIYMWFGAFNDIGNHHLRGVVTICFELFFLFMMIINFITDFTRQGENKPVRNLHQISMRYLKGDFLMDLIPLLPLTLIVTKEHKLSKLLYCIKVIRVLSGFRVFDTHKIF